MRCRFSAARRQQPIGRGEFFPDAAGPGAILAMRPGDFGETKPIYSSKSMDEVHASPDFAVWWKRTRFFSNDIAAAPGSTAICQNELFWFSSMKSTHRLRGAAHIGRGRSARANSFRMPPAPERPPAAALRCCQNELFRFSSMKSTHRLYGAARTGRSRPAGANSFRMPPAPGRRARQHRDFAKTNSFGFLQ